MLGPVVALGVEQTEDHLQLLHRQVVLCDAFHDRQHQVDVGLIEALQILHVRLHVNLR